MADHPGESQASTESSAPGLGDRLDSWKQIAAYLSRDVTTVRRWEKREGLPVHRHLHDKLGSVYASRAEINTWWRSRRAEPAQSPTPDRPNPIATEPPEPPPVRQRTARPEWKAGAASGAAMAATAIVFWFLTLRPSHEGPAPLRFPLDVPANLSVGTLAVSPDGRRIAFTDATADGPSGLWIRQLDDLTVRRIPGTESAFAPFWSPDGRAIGFFAGHSLKKLTIATGVVETLCAAGDGRGGTWNQFDAIVFASDRHQPRRQVPARGGAAVPVTVLAAADIGHVWPEFLPDGRHVLFHVESTDADRDGVYVSALGARDATRVVDARSNAAYTAAGSLLYVRGGRLFAQPFDVARLRTTGDAVPIADHLSQPYGLDDKGDFSVSRAGLNVLAYRAGGDAAASLAWLDRNGTPIGTLGEPALYAAPVLSPDGRRVAVVRFDPDPRVLASDIWTLDTTTGAAERFTSDPGAEFEPVWSPDGKRLVYAATHDGPLALYQKAALGRTEGTLLPGAPINAHPEAWSSDGRYMIYTTYDRESRFDMGFFPQFGARAPLPVARRPGSQGQSQISPDGRFVAYVSDQSGRLEVYVCAFPSMRGRRAVTTGGGADPRWSRDGRELYYIAADRTLMAVPVGSPGAFALGLQQRLFDTGIRNLWEETRNHYDVASDGRFLFAVPFKRLVTAPFTVVVNWSGRGEL